MKRYTLTAHLSPEQWRLVALQRIKGVLWLRGYLADHLHVWNPEDHFIFCQNGRSEKS